MSTATSLSLNSSSGCVVLVPCTDPGTDLKTSKLVQAATKLQCPRVIVHSKLMCFSPGNIIRVELQPYHISLCFPKPMLDTNCIELLLALGRLLAQFCATKGSEILLEKWSPALDDPVHSISHMFLHAGVGCTHYTCVLQTATCRDCTLQSV